jgi:acetylornithine deacetylase/succinyl-diaminopimelate desuccinylase-like protein
MKKITFIEKLLIDLLKIESVTGDEVAVATHIESELSGFRVKRQYVAKERFNIVAQKGTSDVWMVGHMDTVPPFLPIRVTTDKIFGRGAIDNKGNIAGAIVAARAMDDINLLFTVGEEVNFTGAKKARINGKMIILEPTGFKKIFAQCGAISIKIIADGEQKHSSLLVSDNESATHMLIKTLDVLMKRKWFRFNIGIINGGVAGNVVAGSAETVISMRPRTRAEFLDIIKTVRALRGVRVEILNQLPPFTSGLASDAGMKGSRKPAAFFSELSFFENGILFGAGSIAQAHTPEEYILRKDLERLPGKLIKLIEQLARI